MGDQWLASHSKGSVYNNNPSLYLEKSYVNDEALSKTHDIKGKSATLWNCDLQLTV